MITSTTADSIVAKIDQKRLFKEKEILAFLKAQGIQSKEDVGQIISCMVKKNQMPFYFITPQLPNALSETPESVRLIHDMAINGRCSVALSSLTYIYDKDPSLWNYLFNNLKKFKDERTGIPLGYLLVGMGLKNPKKLFAIIKKAKNLSVRDKISYVISINNVSVKKKIPSEILNFVINCRNSKNYLLKNNVISTLVWNFNRVKKVERILKKLCKNEKLCGMICLSLTSIVEKNPKFSLSILKTCSKTTNLRLQDEISSNLAVLSKYYPIECMKILKRWSKNPDILFYPSVKWFLSELGKHSSKKISKFLINWINKETDYRTLMFSLPKITNEIYQNKETELLQLLVKVNYKKKDQGSLVLKILEGFFSEGYGQVFRSGSFIKKTNSILRKIVKHRKLGIKPDPKITNPVLKTLEFINSIRTGQKAPDLKEAKRNLKYFPTLVSLLGKKKLEKIIAKNGHPIVQILSKVQISEKEVKRALRKIKQQKIRNNKLLLISFLKNRIYPYAFLKDLDTSLSLFKPNEQGMSRIKKGLLNPDEFYQTLIEINVASRLKKKFPLMLQPAIKGNLLDVKVDVNGSDHLLEIYAPQGDLRLKYVRTVHGVDNKIKDKILDKINSQLKSTKNENLPVILIIDKTDALEIDEIQIVDALLGTYQWTMLFDKVSKKVVQEYPSRKKDSISTKSQHSDVLSAIILVRRYFDETDYKVKLSGQIFCNPYAAIRLDPKSEQLILNCILNSGIY